METTLRPRATRTTLATMIAIASVVAADKSFAQEPVTDAQISSPDYQDCETNSPWCKTFYFGVQFLPDYDETDESLQGFGKQSFFGHFNFDLLRVADGHDHGGFDLRFNSSGAVTDRPNIEGPDETATNSGSLSRFDQVVQTVDISGYYIFGRSSNGQDYPALKGAPIVDNEPVRSHSSYGLKLLAGARSREGSIRNEDTLSSYIATGFHYGYFDRKPHVKRKSGKDSEIVSIQNRPPTGEFDIGLAYFEEWGGERQRIALKDMRVVVRGVYNLANEFYIGVYANGGRGPDEVSVFFGAKKSVSDLLAFLGLRS